MNKKQKEQATQNLNKKYPLSKYAKMVNDFKKREKFIDKQIAEIYFLRTGQKMSKSTVAGIRNGWIQYKSSIKFRNLIEMIENYKRTQPIRSNFSEPKQKVVTRKRTKKPVAITTMNPYEHDHFEPKKGLLAKIVNWFRK